MKKEDELLGKRILLSELERAEDENYRSFIKKIEESSTEKKRQITRVATDAAKKHAEAADIEWIRLQNWKKRTEQRLLKIYKRKEAEYRQNRKTGYDEIEALMNTSLNELELNTEVERNRLETEMAERKKLVAQAKECLENGKDLKIWRHDSAICFRLPDETPEASSSLTPQVAPA